MVQLVQLLQVVLLQDGGTLHHLSPATRPTLGPPVWAALGTSEPGGGQEDGKYGKLGCST